MPFNADAALAVAGQHFMAGALPQAEVCCQQILAQDPNHLETLNLLGLVYSRAGQVGPAAEMLRRAIALDPRVPAFHNNLGHVLRQQGDVSAANDEFRAAIEVDPSYLKGYSNLLFNLSYDPRMDAAEIRAYHRRWAEQHAASLNSQIRPHLNDRTPDRRLRIGYLSPHFRDHVLAFIVPPVFARHDHKGFAIHCYSDVPRPDAITERIRTFADVWRPVAGLTDAQIADLVRQDRIDIFVDLAMHTSQNRILVFARKPAPVQATWFAYPGTTGLPTMDYRLTDPYIDPPGTDENYTEKSIRLPDSFWCYDPILREPVVNPLPALANGHVTFGCLNQLAKVNPGVLALWARVLAAVPNSRLLVQAELGAHRERVLQAFAGAGIAPDRIDFVPRQRHAQYMATYHRIDIGLDTFPYNGHTTSMDCAWMGVPVVTLAGKTVVGRAGVCQLTNLGLTELIAHTPEQYIQIAATLAADLPRLAALRAGLRQRMQASPLMDGARFARNLEGAYRSMWQTWCRGS